MLLCYLATDTFSGIAILPVFGSYYQSITRNLITIGIDHLNNLIYVSTTYPDTSYVVSGLSNKIISAIPLSRSTLTCLSSHSYAIDNDHNKLFVSNPMPWICLFQIAIRSSKISKLKSDCSAATRAQDHSIASK